ncbi:MAG TPA: hydantoinase/oxoprolinase family protein [Firmicutes bacterium]|nr:hydantoinase/oxoprolinase family protein [Bacillota bacterium]
MTQRLGIGIDTGGTYTDACLFDFDTQTVLDSAKSRTTYHNLAEGIYGAVAALDHTLFPHVDMISLSTTLATNAMVSGRGGRECLLLLGYERDLMEQLSPEVGLTLHKHVYFIDAGLDIHGNETQAVDIQAAREAILAAATQVDAIGISGFLSVVNPAQELAVKALAQELTSLPVTCGHELTGELQSVKRAATVALNARLIPIIKELITALQRALSELGLNAPLVIVQGDGSLVRAEVALKQPVQTILSGPAASCTGAAYLAQQTNCIVVDTGGTTTDIALLRNNMPELSPAGAEVGRWRTSIAAVKVRTTGFGGDSHIRLTKKQTVEVGPQRVVPFCVAAQQWPDIITEIKRLSETQDGILALVQPFDFLCLLRPEAVATLTGTDRRIADALAKGPLSLPQLAQELAVSHPVLLDTRHVENTGIVGRIGLTPTDLLHVKQAFNRFDTAAPQMVVQAIAAMLGKTVTDFIAYVDDLISERLALEILSHLLGTDEPHSLPVPGCPSCHQLVKLGLKQITPEDKGGLHCNFKLDYPLIALGAPGDIYLRRTAALLGAHCLVPHYGEVANAVGAVTGNVVCTVTCSVVPMYNTVGVTGYQITGLPNGEQYTEFEPALQAAREQAVRLAKARAHAAGAGDLDIHVTVNKVEEVVHLETAIEVTAIGKPDYQQAATTRR